MPLLQNYTTGAGYVYCHLNRKAAKVDTLPCEECPHYYGSLQGAGRECMVDDGEEVIQIEDPFEAEEKLSKKLS